MMNSIALIDIALDSSNMWDSWESLGLEYLATVLRERGVSADIYTVTLKQMDECISDIVNKPPILVGFTLPCFYESKLSYVGSRIKMKIPRVHISVGNRYATDNAVELLEKYGWLDSVMRGEGENTILELYKRLVANKDLGGCEGLYYKNHEGLIHKNPDRLLIEDLDCLPMVHRDMIIKKHIRHAWFCSSRGCVNDCAFCNSRCDKIQKGKIIRLRRPKNVVDELEYLYRNLQCNHITFVDCSYEDPGIVGKGRIRSIAELIIQRELKINYGVYFSAHNWKEENIPLLKFLHTSGLNYAYIGFESGYENTLRLFNKKATVEDNELMIQLCEKAGISIKYGFIMYHPYLSLEEFKINNEFLYRNGLAYSLESYYNELFVYKGTAIYEKVRIDNLLNGAINMELGSYGWMFRDEDAAKIHFYYTKLAELQVVQKIKSREWVYKIIDIKYYYREEDMSNKQLQVYGNFLEKLKALLAQLNKMNYELANDLVELIQENDENIYLKIRDQFETRASALVDEFDKLIIRYVYSFKKAGDKK